ncbi:MAG TPA: substrate-binding domain-containing protein [Kiritimatiellia bacterium]|nr:substrate-binding domain-containing protein [Kiritimatiellia bacterium]
MKTASIPLVVASLVLSVVIGLVISRQGGGGAGRGAVARAPTIGLSLDTLKEARWQRDRDLFVKRVEELGGRVLVQSANSDDTRQIQDVNALIAREVDVLVIVPHNGAAMAEGVRSAKLAGIPVIAYDRMITESDLDLYLSFDNVQVGEQQARWLVDHLPGGRGRIVRIYGAPTDHNAVLFKQGQDQVLKPLIEKGLIEVVHEDWTVDWDPSNAKKIMNAALTRAGTDLQGVLASNDGTAGGAIQALREAELEGRVLVTGQDADVVACQRIARGTQSMTIYKPLPRLALAAAELAMNLAQGRPVVARAALPNGFRDVPAVLEATIAVDRNNLRETVIADGFHSEADVFGAASGSP